VVLLLILIVMTCEVIVCGDAEVRYMLLMIYVISIIIDDDVN
jgi:hypothetical protein